MKCIVPIDDPLQPPVRVTEAEALRLTAPGGGWHYTTKGAWKASAARLYSDDAARIARISRRGYAAKKGAQS
jgi:hypothetical protein